MYIYNNILVTLSLPPAASSNLWGLVTQTDFNIFYHCGSEYISVTEYISFVLFPNFYQNEAKYLLNFYAFS